MTNFSLAVIPSQGIIIILLSLTLGKFQVPYNNRKLQAKLYPASSEGSVWTCDCLLSTLSVRSDSQENNTVKCQDQHFSLSLSLFSIPLGQGAVLSSPHLCCSKLTSWKSQVSKEKQYYSCCINYYSHWEFICLSLNEIFVFDFQVHFLFEIHKIMHIWNS